MFKSKMLAGWSMEQNWKRSPKLHKSAHIHSYSCTKWIQDNSYFRCSSVKLQGSKSTVTAKISPEPAHIHTYLVHCMRNQG